MKISLDWLRELVDAHARRRRRRAAADAGRARGRGARRSSARSRASSSRACVGKRPHPDAAKLTLVDVDDGSGKTTQVVCGAPNVPDAGGLVLVGAAGRDAAERRHARREAGARHRLAGHAVRRGRARARHVARGHHRARRPATASRPATTSPSKLGLPDEIWELNVTPNRPDCLGHVGVAREVAALVGARLQAAGDLPALPSGGAPAQGRARRRRRLPALHARVAVDGVTVAAEPAGGAAAPAGARRARHHQRRRRDQPR